jgi:hypothetical protein
MPAGWAQIYITTLLDTNEMAGLDIDGIDGAVREKLAAFVTGDVARIREAVAEWRMAGLRSCEASFTIIAAS